MDYRHELKYVVTAAELALMENRMKGLVRPDAHAGACILMIIITAAIMKMRSEPIPERSSASESIMRARRASTWS